MNLTRAMKIAQTGFDVWAAKPHNKRWAKLIDGTPIPNDLVVCIAHEFALVLGPEEARPAPAVVSVPPMTDDQRVYVAKAAAREPVDLNHVVGGPKARPAPVVDREGEPSEDFIRLVAEAMGARTGYSISLTRLVDGVETYTLSMDGYEPQDFDDRDEAAEVLHQRLNRDRAKRLLALLSPATSPGEG